MGTTWDTRISNANKYYTEWENLFECKVLEDYYEGRQWKINKIGSYRPYVLNLVFSTIAIKLANVIYQKPEFILTPAPGHDDWNQDFAVQSAIIKQDTLNTVVNNRHLNFVPIIKLAAKDSFFRFGIIETGYAADWQNPNKTPLTTTADLDNEVTIEDARLLEDLEVPTNERVYFKHIQASRFRVSVSDSPFLSNCSWCGYYSFILRSTLEKTKGIKFPVKYDTEYYSSEYANAGKSGNKEMQDLLNSGEACKVWRIWDNHHKKKLMFLDDHFDEPMWEGEFDHLPFSELANEKRLDGSWYPIPPVWHWLSPQDEINEAREQMRNYRKRFIRKFWYLKGKVDPLELEKLANNVDGEVIEFKTPEAVGQIPNPEIGVSIQSAIVVTKEDFNTVSGTSAQARGQADRQTATATKITDLREQIRESAEQMDFSEFICSVGREALIVIGENFSGGMWIKASADSGEQILEEVNAQAPIYKHVSARDIEDGYDFEISLNVVNATPARMQEEETKFVKFLTLTSQFPQISLSPTLIRETAYKVGYRNEKVIKEMQRSALLAMMAQAAQMQNEQGNIGSGDAASASMDANANPNPTKEIDSQLEQQVG